VTASVKAELATLPGYEIRVTRFAGAAILADYQVPTTKAQYYLVGVFGKSRYVTSREIRETHYDEFGYSCKGAYRTTREKDFVRFTRNTHER
jgi:hypothetical protein